MSRSIKLAEALSKKEASDEELRRADKTIWYKIDDKLLSSKILNLYHPLTIDNETQEFLNNSMELSNNVFWQMFYSISIGMLSIFTTKTNINGILDRGRMHVFSTGQLYDFLQLPNDWDSSQKTVLDLGAGDGMVTKKLSVYYNNVYATEMSNVMRWRLKQKGFNIIDAEEWYKNDIIKNVDLISVLNLLDRHYNPSLLLSQLHEASLKSGAKILMAIVLPIKQYVEFHPSNNKNTPDSSVSVKGHTFEEQVESMINDIFTPLNFKVIRFSKAPYLCEGDHVKGYYRLTDALFLLEAVNGLNNNMDNTIENNFDNDRTIERQEL
uniref:Methyltransferase-like protein 9 n=1 Tax=Parastrongyloides trichosuri TaxID=131310 RepID=A0A0N4Z1L9_PARTI